MKGRPAHFRVCVTKKWEEVGNQMVQNLMFLKHSQIICELCRYCPLSSILPFWPLLHLFDICYLNHSVSYYLKCVNRIPNSNQFFVSVFHLGYSKYLVKSVYLVGLLGLLIWIERERYLFHIWVDWYHLFEREIYICIFWSYLVQI